MSSKPRFQEKNERFQYGFHGGPSQDPLLDCRLRLLKREWFESKRVLDLGCGDGTLTLHIAQHYNPSQIDGLDIDPRAISLARKNIPRTLSANICLQENFPASFRKSYGQLMCTARTQAKEPEQFPNNVRFLQEDYVPREDDPAEEGQYDTILCLQLTKWLHLHAGDEGLKRSFCRMFRQLRPGGLLVLEAQAWPSYSRAKNLTEKMYQTYQSIDFRPDQFNGFLLSPEVGFSGCSLVGAPLHSSRKVFHRSIYLFTKS